jgi:purine-binding chemotaxis protein CheW
MQERLLLFTLAGQGFALDLQEVAEVMEPQPSYPVPRAPGHFLGLINFHSTLTALVDLARYLGLDRRPAPQGKIVVLDPRLASLALAADGVVSVIPGSSVSGRSQGDDPLGCELLTTEFGPFRLLKTEKLLELLEAGLDGSQPEAPQP